MLASLATLAFVVVFNFFLFRVIEGDPVANLFRGRNLTDVQRQQLTGSSGSTSRWAASSWPTSSRRRS